MARYKFPQFSVELTDPIMSVVSATYAIGQPTGSVSVILETPDARLRGVTFDGFPNDGEWSDADVMSWAEEQLELHRVD